ncbi:sigma-54-dependent Fis family transcriptional regulator, partial [Candidatus Sumerlaeota bacterium]|nr:sigma-54-dependent Fis family transcriptional regulator [Candidatus Sumerlaeota bacterium]
MQACPKVLIVEGDEELRSIMRTVIEKAGMESVEASEGLSAVNIAASHSPDVMFLGCHLPDMTASEVFSRARELNTSLPVIVIAGCGEESAMGMLEAGACDCLLKPFTTDQLLQSIQQALSDNRHERPKPRAIHGAKKHHLPLEEQMGHSAKIKALAGEVGRVAPTDFSVLISGETGSGKEIVAQAIYAQSNRRARPFIAIDCGAIAETLIESELFGHEKGAFTGADRTKPGKFEIAAGGTVFLDEISSLPLSLQAKLLRFLQERHFYRVGGTSSIKADARILAATNHDLANAPATVFRRDLYHRLGEYTICVTPLRDRKEDIIHLARRFLKQTNAELGKKVCDFSQEALDLLLAYNWPGNVRELRNVVRRGVLL